MEYSVLALTVSRMTHNNEEINFKQTFMEYVFWNYGKFYKSCIDVTHNERSFSSKTGYFHAIDSYMPFHLKIKIQYLRILTKNVWFIVL